MKNNNSYLITFKLYDENLGLSSTKDLYSLIQYHIKEGNITLDDMELISVNDQEVL